MNNRQIVVRSKTIREVPRKRTKRRRTRNRNRRMKNPALMTARNRSEQFHLSECSDLYLRVLCEPFQPYSSACVPDLNDTPSQKIRTVQRGVVNIGTASRGFIAVDVWRNAFNNTGAVLATDLGFATDAIGSTAITGVVGHSNAQSPYPIASLGSGDGFIQFRPVAVGVRIRYIGTELDKSGRTIPFRHPTNRAINTYTEESCLAYAETHPQPVARKWSAATWVPTSSQDYDYQIAITNFVGVPGVNRNTICIFIDGKPGIAYEYEVVSYYEYTGAVANATPSHSDIQGVSAIRGFIENQVSSIQGSMYQKAMNYFSNLTPDDISGWTHAATYAGRKAAPLLLGL